MNQLLKDFLKKHDVDDVVEEVVGELNEYSTKRATYFYGNGELLISPANENEPEQTYFADRIGFNYQLVKE